VPNITLNPITPLGSDDPITVTIGEVKIVQNSLVALASLAVRRGCDAELIRKAKMARLPLAPVALAVAGPVFGTVWLSDGLWLVEAPIAEYEDISQHLRLIFDSSASITEQTGAWVRFDVTSKRALAVFEKLTNLDLATCRIGFASRTTMEHVGCYLIKRSDNLYTVYGPSSSAQFLQHALIVTAQSII
jgi:sarcosine oxidase subunit gamma